MATVDRLTAQGRKADTLARLDQALEAAARARIDSPRLVFADYPVSVRIPHVRVCRMIAAHG